MKLKQKIDTVMGAFLLLIGIGLLVLPLFIKINNIKLVLTITFSSFGIINLIKYYLNKETKDIEGILTFIANTITIACIYIVKTENVPMDLSIILMIWITLISLVKLKKADYYHDRRDRMWKLNIFMLIIFIITGLLTAINLAYEGTVQTIVIGFFFFINGILCLIDPIVKSLIAHS